MRETDRGGRGLFWGLAGLVWPGEMDDMDGMDFMDEMDMWGVGQIGSRLPGGGVVFQGVGHYECGKKD